MLADSLTKSELNELWPYLTKRERDEWLRLIAGPKSECLWPAEYVQDSAECAWKFVRECWTWNEAEQEEQRFPDKEYLRRYAFRWWHAKKHGTALCIEKCRRQVISWLCRALELWAMGLRKTDCTLCGEDLEAAAKHVWRLQFLFQGLRKRHSDWKLPDSDVIRYRGERLLVSFGLPNGSLCQYSNGQGNSIRGEGTAIITLEEFGTYPYASDMLAQAKIITKGSAGKVGGFVNIITNASFNDAWQLVKKPTREPGALVEEIKGLEFMEMATGMTYLKLHHFADPLKDQDWLEEIRGEMADTPVTFRLEILMDDSKVEGALVSRETIERTRVKCLPPEILMRVIAIDPTVSDPKKRKNPNKEIDDCGVVVMSLAMVENVGHIYIESDLSGKYSPAYWSELVKKLAKKLDWLGRHVHQIVYEENQGGELVRMVLDEKDPKVLFPTPIVSVHASDGKRARAEPLAALWENSRVHVVNHLTQLEDEWCTWDASNPGALSPARVDATVWGAHAMGLAMQQEIMQVGKVSGARRKAS